MNLLSDLAATVKVRTALAVRNAALIIEDTAWTVLNALDVAADGDADPLARLGDTLRVSGYSLAMDVDGQIITPQSILGISPDLASLHAGVRDDDAYRAVKAAISWCLLLIKSVPATASEIAWFHPENLHTYLGRLFRDHDHDHRGAAADSCRSEPDQLSLDDLLNKPPDEPPDQ